MKFRLYEGRRIVPHTKSEMGIDTKERVSIPEEVPTKKSDPINEVINEVMINVHLATTDASDHSSVATGCSFSVPFVRLGSRDYMIDYDRLVYTEGSAEDSWMWSWKSSLYDKGIRTTISASVTGKNGAQRPLVFILFHDGNSVKATNRETQFRTMTDLCIQLDKTGVWLETLPQEHFYLPPTSVTLDWVIRNILTTLKKHFAGLLFYLANEEDIDLRRE